MAYTSGSRGTVIDRFQLVSIDETKPVFKVPFDETWSIDKLDLQPDGFFVEVVRSNSLTTPENPKASPEVPKAPMKPRKTARRDDLPRRKLEFTEPEVEENLLDPGPTLFPPKTSSQNNLQTMKYYAPIFDVSNTTPRNELRCWW